MLIEDDFSSTNGNPTASHKLPEFFTPRADVSFFTSALEHSTLLRISIGRPHTSNLLSVASELLTDSTSRMTKSLQAFSKKNDEKAMSHYPGHLSNTLLLTHVVVKGVGKTAQCVEKICNLQ
ncbi:hypothetical protein P0D91_15705 [Pseudomonas sp. CBSPBW29]|jgi:hypothetical protein|uniref:hypothetical protein n=1 Tax=Pseudomonas TaxID=286 RepID=UPI0021ACC7E2|nr:MULTISPECIES: hypothetical protein [unclassified Pseudomonas]WEL45472.1 hypothetical protein P0D91_15705 [Pseudomonas sp. CBSPBW29]WEL66576.1 hypothetical protein P0D93_09845 [Pseudomonas sp. CBSPGW29]WEL70065.1 hypothetical protein P0D94_29170 [Pseudomonas sp. CBSPCGW29]WEL77019.1 hypothetical protein P0D92_01785 [Pseudomonas sp. CBSPAW29]WEL84375.1 hypothetical protein P0D95_10580 [Pseudomonas sp. CBSPCAW29]WEL87203.1 hypothetical protein P0D90_26305 [Pseudomonas sp. CBSPCBW29]